MEPFEIKVVGESLTVIPLPDGSFDIFRGETLYTKLTRSKSGSGTGWQTEAPISSDHVQEIASQIEQHQL